MKNFIKNIALLLAIFNLFSFTTFADLKTGNNFDLGNSTGVIVPLPGNEKEEQPDVPADNNNSGGGGSYRPSTKPTEKPEPEQEPVQPENNINTFTDVKQDDWFYSDVMFVFNNKIMTGTGENEFSPDTTLNRAMMITILYRIDKDDSIYEKNIFNDVEKNSWYETAVNWGYENKIVTGTGEKTFSPMDNLTREQLCVMLYNYTKHIGVNTEFADISSYTDEEMVSDWAKEAVTWAVHEKIVTGKGNNSLAPQDSATRAETAAVIRRYAEKFVEIEEK
ncbi:MAG: S-layer homology domain-containing protein [Clostridia bacterium]|nr:S-layer homology domain-containing protein [Clostridia bacterium]